MNRLSYNETNNNSRKTWSCVSSCDSVDDIVSELAGELGGEGGGPSAASTSLITLTFALDDVRVRGLARKGSVNHRGMMGNVISSLYVRGFYLS
jgi:hypothetical protein